MQEHFYASEDDRLYRSCQQRSLWSAETWISHFSSRIWRWTKM